MDPSFTVPQGSVVPDFLIVGAMKAGTSSLHRILNQHPEVFIPEIEPHFFCCDDLDECYETLVMRDGRWVTPAEYHGWEKLWRWYSKLFREAAEAGKRLGEDCTGYLSSRIALRRIASLPQPPKIIVSLRHPTARAYSQYWHMVKTGRAVYSFENTIRFSPATVLRRSCYVDDLRNVLELFGRQNVHVVVFEEFRQDPVAVMERLCAFLGLDWAQLGEGWRRTHANPSQLPRWPGVDLYLNRFLYHTRHLRYLSQFELADEYACKLTPAASRVLNRIRRALNPMKVKRPPPMASGLNDMLTRYFHRELEGLNEVLERDVLSWWPRES